jgi:hypothetical protein
LTQVHSVLDDLLYNIVHDLLLKTHRDEKLARANTAAIKVEKIAADATNDPAAPETRPDIRIEISEAIYEDGKVFLKGNPLKTTKEILCPRCRLPRLLYPIDGKGARKPDPGVIYCKKYPYIEKPGYDIYGQTWVAPGPGRGKKKKDMEKKIDPKTDSPGNGTPAPESRPANTLSYPSATCSKCKRCILVTRLNNHMGSCIGNSGRNASRAAAQKISNGNGNSQGERTPPSGTPLSGSRAGSPRKRSGDELDDGADEDEPINPKKKIKAGGAGSGQTKKVILKTKVPLPTHGLHKKHDKMNSSNNSASSLSQEQKADDFDSSRPLMSSPATGTSIEATPHKKKTKIPSPAKKLKLGAPIPKSKPPLTSPNPGKIVRDRDAGSESSGTLSSPPGP